MNLHVAYHFKESDGTMGFGSYIAENISHPPNSKEDLDRMKEEARKGHKDTKTSIVLFNWIVF